MFNVPPSSNPVHRTLRDKAAPVTSTLGRKAVQTEPLQEPKTCPSSSEHHVAKFVLAVLAMILPMVWSVYDKGPSGQSLDTKGFILLWLRELIILAFVVIALVIGCIGWLRRGIQQHRGGNHAS